MEEEQGELGGGRGVRGEDEDEEGGGGEGEGGRGNILLKYITLQKKGAKDLLNKHGIILTENYHRA